MVKINNKSEFLSPADRFRKQLKKKELDRNRKERNMNRFAISRAKKNINELREELGSILKSEENGKHLDKGERLRKKVFQEQFKAGIRRAIEENKKIEIEKHGGSILESEAIYDPIKAALALQKESIKEQNMLQNGPYESNQTCDLSQIQSQLQSKEKSDMDRPQIRLSRNDTISILNNSIKKKVTKGNDVLNPSFITNFESNSYLVDKIDVHHKKNQNTLLTSLDSKSKVLFCAPTTKPTFSASRNKELLNLIPTNVRVRRENATDSKKTEHKTKHWIKSGKITESCLDTFMKEVYDLE